MNGSLDYFFTYGPTGKIYARCLGDIPSCHIKYQLYLNDKLLQTENGKKGELVVFPYSAPGRYRIHADIHPQQGDEQHLCSDEIKPVYYDLLPSPTVEIKSLKRPLTLVADQPNVLVVKFTPGGLKKLNNEPSECLPIYYQLRHGIRFTPFFSQRVLDKVSKYSAQMKKLRHLYKIEPDISNAKLLELANELQRLDYVEYCDLLGKFVDQKSIPPLSPIVPEPPVPASTPTPNFVNRQGYLDPRRGLNIRAVWDLGTTGQGVTFRLGGNAIVADHEDLAGINVVSNPPGLATNADTASAGVIMARNNGFGVTGIAHHAEIYFYHLYSGGIEQFIEDLLPGDIACNPLTSVINNNVYLPIIHHPVWWDIYGSLVSDGVVLVLNGGVALPNGLDLSNSIFEDHGDNGVILAAACNPQTGRRLPVANYNLRNFVNVWGNSVASCGYGDLFNPDNDVRRQYTANFGTSGTPPMAAAVLALMQSHAKHHYHTIFNNQQMMRILEATGYRDGVNDHIGVRPNTAEAIRYIDLLLGDGSPSIPQWSSAQVHYWAGSLVVFEGQVYICLREHRSNPNTAPNVTPTLWLLLA